MSFARVTVERPSACYSHSDTGRAQSRMQHAERCMLVSVRLWGTRGSRGKCARVRPCFKPFFDGLDALPKGGGGAPCLF